MRTVRGATVARRHIVKGVFMAADGYDLLGTPDEHPKLYPTKEALFADNPYAKAVGCVRVALILEGVAEEPNPTADTPKTAAEKMMKAHEVMTLLMAAVAEAEKKKEDDDYPPF